MPASQKIPLRLFKRVATRQRRDTRPEVNFDVLARVGDLIHRAAAVVEGRVVLPLYQLCRVVLKQPIAVPKQRRVVVG